MKKIAIAAALSAALSACTSLTYQERNTLRSLQAQGITVDKPLGGWESPASPAGAGLLNILPALATFIWLPAMAATAIIIFMAF